MVQPPCAGDGRQSRCRNRLIYVWLPRPTNGTGGLELSVHSPQRALPTACIPHSVHSLLSVHPLPSLHSPPLPPHPHLSAASTLAPVPAPPTGISCLRAHRYVVTARGTQRERKRRRPDKRGAVRSRSDEQQSAAARQRDRDVRRQRHLLGCGDVGGTAPAHPRPAVLSTVHGSK